MTIEEVSERYRIKLNILKEYESWGLRDTKVIGVDAVKLFWKKWQTAKKGLV